MNDRSNYPTNASNHQDHQDDQVEPPIDKPKHFQRDATEKSFNSAHLSSVESAGENFQILDEARNASRETNVFKINLKIERG